jgi:hypothetical protein
MMTVADFRRIALSLEGAEEGSHFGSPDFRVGGRIFATLAAQAKGYGNLMLTPEQQAAFVAEAPQVFLPVPGGWGRNGATHVNLAAANEDLVDGALQTAWKLRMEKNRKAPKKRMDGTPTLATKTNREDGAWSSRGGKQKRKHPGEA